MKLRPMHNRHGMALALTVVVVTLLTIIVFDRFHAAWIESALAASYRDEAKAFYAARSGQMAARLVLLEDLRRRGSVDDLTEEWAQPGIPAPVEEEYVFITIADESGKFDLNALTSDKGYPQERMIAIFRRLLGHLEIDPTLADAVVDWIDPNPAPRPGGAEDGYYLSLERPYTAKNGKFDSVAELALVRGFTPDIVKKLEPHITVWSSKKINVNTATPLVLLSLDDGMSPELVKAITLYRLDRPFGNTRDFKKAPGMSAIYPRVALDIGINSDVFSVHTTATFDETSRAILAVYRRQGGGKALGTIQTLFTKTL